MKVLFISHDAYRAGAQLLLLSFLRWLKINEPALEFEILLANPKGELKSDFEAVAPTFIWISKSKNPLKQIKYKLFLKKLSDRKFNLIYSNTIVNGKILHELSLLKINIITHIHEMNYWIKRAGQENLFYIKKHTSMYITTSHSVKKCLVEQYGIDSNFIYPIYGFTSIEPEFNFDKNYSLKQKLGLPETSIIIGASGAEMWRKGKDWFVPLAIEVFSLISNDEIHFVWIGGQITEELKYDLDLSGLSDRIHFIPHMANASKYFHEFTVFTLLSREEPLGLVVLESAANAVPSICFEGIGGTQEILSEGGGYVVPYANLHAFAEKIVYLINNEEERTKMGHIAKETVKTKFDINVIGPQLVKQIRSFNAQN